MSNLTKFESVVQQTLSSGIGLDIIFLVDGSGSIGAEDWQIAKMVLRALTRFYLVNQEKNNQGESKVKVAMVQFSSSPRTESHFTDDAHKLTLAIDGMAQMRGGTATAEAFKHCHNLFNLAARPNCQHVVFVLTDGIPDDMTSAERESRNLTLAKHKADIIVVGVGSINQMNLARLGTPGFVFIVKTMQELSDMVVHLHLKPSGPPVLNLVKSEPYKLVVKVTATEAVSKYIIERLDPRTNQWERIIHNAATPVITFAARPAELFILRALVIYKASNAISAPSITYQEKTPLPMAKLPENLEKAVDKLREDIANFDPSSNVRQHPKVKYYNILMMGATGSGKSSFTNTVMSAMCGRWKPSAITRISVDSVTLTLNIYHISKRIRLWDVWGWTSKNYSFELKPLLKGNLKKGFGEDKNSDLAEQMKKGKFRTDAFFKDRAHAVIFLCDVASINVEANTSRLSEFYNIVGNTREDIGGLQAQVLLTKVDKHDADVKDNSSTIYNSAEILGMRKTLAVKAMVEEKQIYPQINYTGDYGDQRDLVIEYLTLSAIWRAIVQAETFAEQKYTYSAQRKERRVMENKRRSRRRHNYSSDDSDDSQSDDSPSMKDKGRKYSQTHRDDFTSSDDDNSSNNYRSQDKYNKWRRGNNNFTKKDSKGRFSSDSQDSDEFSSEDGNSSAKKKDSSSSHRPSGGSRSRNKNSESSEDEYSPVSSSGYKKTHKGQKEREKPYAKETKKPSFHQKKETREKHKYSGSSEDEPTTHYNSNRRDRNHREPRGRQSSTFKSKNNSESRRHSSKHNPKPTIGREIKVIRIDKEQDKILDISKVEHDVTALLCAVGQLYGYPNETDIYKFSIILNNGEEISDISGYKWWSHLTEIDYFKVEF